MVGLLAGRELEIDITVAGNRLEGVTGDFVPEAFWNLSRGESVTLPLGQVGDVSRQRDAAAIDDRDPLAKSLDLGEQVRVEEDSDALRLQGLENPPDVDAANGIDAIGRFVQDQQVRLVQQGLRQTDAL